MFGSQRCDCGGQLERSLERVAAEGGVVVYLRGHEGRGVGLLSKLQAYALQDNGFDTVDAQTELGLPIDAREYAAGAAILADLDVASVRLLTNNPMKVNAMREYGIEVVAVERLSMVPGAHNAAYLRTKRDRMGHDLILDEHDKGSIRVKQGSPAPACRRQRSERRHRCGVLAHHGDGRADRRRPSGPGRCGRVVRGAGPGAGSLRAARCLLPIGGLL